MSRVTKQTPLVPIQPDDAALIAQVVEGDEKAFALLYRRHARYVAGVVYRLMGNDAELDDVMQEAFCDAARMLRSLREPSGLRPWLARIAVRRVYRRMARRRRWRWLSSALETVSPPSSDPAVRQQVDGLYEALDHLPLKLRTPWVIHMIEGETLPETAKMCDVSLATIKRRVAEAEERLKRWTP